ncbi:MAG: hypothetical protein HY286_07355 [Planctomycetes bacterium]|nr:hypothetical protein [Planctomycetota bacterium]
MPVPGGANLPYSAAKLKQILEERVSAPLEVVIVKNAWTVLRQTRFKDGRRRVRVHEIFLDAPIDVLLAIGDWVRKPTKAANLVLDTYVLGCHDRIRALTPPTPIRTRGKNIDLAPIFLKLQKQYFEKTIDCNITFGDAPGASRRGRRAIQYGVYDSVKKLIRIHPVLDEPWISRAFVEFIVFHEMLHAALGVEIDLDGRRAHHPPRFRALERAFDRYEEARKWEDVNFNKILRAAREVTQIR